MRCHKNPGHRNLSHWLCGSPDLFRSVTMSWIFVDICPFDYISTYGNQRLPLCFGAAMQSRWRGWTTECRNRRSHQAWQGLVFISECMKNLRGLYCNCANLKQKIAEPLHLHADIDFMMHRSLRVNSQRNVLGVFSEKKNCLSFLKKG